MLRYVVKVLYSIFLVGICYRPVVITEKTGCCIIMQIARHSYYTVKRKVCMTHMWCA